ncbi:copper chaperone PCu(A)C [uncultured Endozoicomonas sp.]|uniref:copper chaperone PCu(A)C n=1 Tax=uncultured Endozoicomonas sp. TaxID=432652 RepID=UPI002634217D|nr:copper chaperone PCu(A)C [uncultured Endozoicomonas sp.]
MQKRHHEGKTKRTRFHAMVSGVMAAALLLVGQSASAHENGHGSHDAQGVIELSGVMARATKPGMSTSAAYMVIRNTSDEAVTIESIDSPVAKKTELHTTTKKDGMMKMQRVDNLEILPGQEVQLKPGGYHVMLMGLNNPITNGSEVPVTITFSNGEKQTVKAHGMESIKGQHMAHH